jgi:hypothetical protein
LQVSFGDASEEALNFASNFHGRWLTPVPITVLVGEPLRVPQPKVRGDKPDDTVVEEYPKKHIERVKEMHKRQTESS